MRMTAERLLLFGKKMDTQKISNLLLRVGVAFAFLYPPVNALSNPDSWIGYFPKFIHGIVPDLVLLHSFGLIEVIIALWILSGKKIFWPSLIATAMIVTIVLANLNNFEILFRDLYIAAMALSLVFKSKSNSTEKSSIN